MGEWGAVLRVAAGPVRPCSPLHNFSIFNRHFQRKKNKYKVLARSIVYKLSGLGNNLYEKVVLKGRPDSPSSNCLDGKSGLDLGQSVCPPFCPRSIKITLALSIARISAGYAPELSCTHCSKRPRSYLHTFSYAR